MEAIEIPLHSRSGIVAVTLVDADFADVIAAHRWHRNNHGYAVRAIYHDKRKESVFLHRWLLGLSRGDGLQCDHINGDRLDNRLCNLRVVSHAQNAQNRTRFIPGTSRHRGVSYQATRNRPKKWMAAAKIDGKSHTIGYYLTEDEADAAARAFRAEHMPFATS